MSAPNDEHRPLPRTWWIAVGIGGAIMTWGVWFYLDATSDWARRLDFAKWLIGLALAHDLLFAPIVVTIGWLVTRTVPGSMRAPVQAGLIASGCVLLVALPPLRETANASRNPTIQPLEYSTATLTVLAVVWTVVGAWTVIRFVRRASLATRASEVRHG